MKALAICISISLFFCPALFAADHQEELLQSHEERITRLENQLEHLQALLAKGQSSQSQLMSSSSDPLWGRWDCSDGSFHSEINFTVEGYLLQKDIVLGSTRRVRWVRVSNTEITLASGNTYVLEFASPDQFSAMEDNVRSTWVCSRIEN